MAKNEEVLTIKIPFEARETEEYKALLLCIKKLKAIIAASESSQLAESGTSNFANLEDFVMRQVPADWSKWSIQKRIEFWSHPIRQNTILIERDRICAAEIWCELLGESFDTLNNRFTACINKKLSKLEGWKVYPSTLRYGPYGVQRGFVKEIKKSDLFNDIIGISNPDN